MNGLSLTFWLLLFNKVACVVVILVSIGILSMVLNDILLVCVECGERMGNSDRVISQQNSKCFLVSLGSYYLFLFLALP